MQSRIPGMQRGFGPATALGIVDKHGELAAAFVFHDWDPEAGVIQLSAASVNRRWMSRAVIRDILAYPFKDLGCQMVVGRTDPDLTHLLRIWRRLGAEVYNIPRLRGRDKAEALVCLTDDAFNASDFGETHGQEVRTRAA